MKLSQMIRELCNQRGWSIARLAREAGVPPQTVHNWAVGRKSVNPDQVRKIASTLGASLHYLMFGEPDPTELKTSTILEEVFSGDVRVTIHRIGRARSNQESAD